MVRHVRKLEQGEMYAAAIYVAKYLVGGGAMTKLEVLQLY